MLMLQEIQCLNWSSKTNVPRRVYKSHAAGKESKTCSEGLSPFPLRVRTLVNRKENSDPKNDRLSYGFVICDSFNSEILSSPYTLKLLYIKDQL